ncbi:hypothetical protein I4U23_007365 [Adineta vaga]|nr:hypothetical protein I4U23_007365 [Adineta vaga]
MSLHPSTTYDQISSTDTNLNEFYSTYETHSSSSSYSLSPSTKINSEFLTNPLSSSNTRKDTILKLPYPVLSDHRDPSSVLILLQKETQTTAKKISNVIRQIEECERRLILNNHTDNEKKTFKYERVKFKQQLDALKKHERRVSLQIDFITTKSEIKGLEDEHKQSYENVNSDESQQIKILLGKLKQKLDKMKIYMRTRNEQMKKISNGKLCLNNTNDYRKSSLLSSQKQQRVNSSSTKDSNRKRSSTSTTNSLSNKRSTLLTPMVRLSSHVTNHNSKEHSIQPPIVRFLNKTTDPTNNSASPTTPASSSSTLSLPLLTSKDHANHIINSFQPNGLPSAVDADDDDDDDDDDDELHLDLNIDELFEDDSYADQTVQRLKVEMNTNSLELPIK